MIETSTITYAVAGCRYVAAVTDDGQSGSRGPLGMAQDMKAPRGQNAVYVFALPQQKSP